MLTNIWVDTNNRIISNLKCDIKEKIILPIYEFINTKTGVTETHLFSFAEEKEFLEKNPNFERVLSLSNLDRRGMIGKKPSENMRKKLDGLNRYYKKNTLHTY